MNAEIIAKALDGCRAGAGWMAHCPAHDDRTPSLSVRDFTDGKVLVRCHASCDQEWVIAALRRASALQSNKENRSSRENKARRHSQRPTGSLENHNVTTK